jgi:ABC-type amino acid transport substrate-binding protein
MLEMNIFILLFLALSSFKASANIDSDEIRMGYNTVPPFMIHQQKKEPTGIAIDYFHLISKKMNIGKIKFVHMPLARLLASLESNAIDAALLLGPSTGNLKLVYPSKNFAFFYPGLLLRKDSKLNKVNKSSQLVGLRIGTKLKMPLTKTMSDAKINIDYISGTKPLQKNIKKMILNRIDAVYSPTLQELIYMAKKQGINEKVKGIHLPDKPFPVFTVFSKNGAKKYLKKYEKALETTSKEMPYKTFLNTVIKSN